MFQNPYKELHREFTAEGAEVLLSSGQACVMYGIAAFSKDGDWIIEESESSCAAVLSVLERKGADYRLGAPLDTRFLKKARTSHFEFFREDMRIRVDFCSRPPRVNSTKTLWEKAVRKTDIDIVDVESLILLKQTRRIRDYSIIGTLAEVIGFNENVPEIALEYLQDYDHLKQAVDRWPDFARKSKRKAVTLLVDGRARKDVVIEIATEQDDYIQKDEQRIRGMMASSGEFQTGFAQLKRKWKETKEPLSVQHEQLLEMALAIQNIS